MLIFTNDRQSPNELWTEERSLDCITFLHSWDDTNDYSKLSGLANLVLGFHVHGAMSLRDSLYSKHPE